MRHSHDSTKLDEVNAEDGDEYDGEVRDESTVISGRPVPACTPKCRTPGGIAEHH